MKKHLAYLITAACIAGSVVPAEIDIGGTLKAAKKMLRNKQPDVAVTLLLTIAEKSSDPEILYVLSEAYYESGNKDKAVQALVSLVKDIRRQKASTGRLPLKKKLMLGKAERRLAAYDKAGEEIRAARDEFVKKMAALAREMIVKKEKLAAENAIRLISKIAPSSPELAQIKDRYNKAFPEEDMDTGKLTSLEQARLKRAMEKLPEALQNINPELDKVLIDYKIHDNGITLNLEKNRQLVNIKPLKGLPLTSLKLSFTGVADLSPLKEAPLKILHLHKTPVKDLSPLKGLPLEYLNLFQAPVSNLEPLSRMPLVHLDLYETEVQDVSALAATKKLTWLALSSTPLKSIAPLKDLKLEELYLRGCKNLNDLTPLAEIKTLQRLSIPSHAQNISFLKKLPNLLFLTSTQPKWAFRQRAKDFWKKWEKQKK